MVELFMYIAYFAMLFSVYRLNIVMKLKNLFKTYKYLLLLEMLGKVVWGIGVSVTGAFIYETLSFTIFMVSGFWLGIIIITLGVFIEVKALEGKRLLERKEK